MNWIEQIEKLAELNKNGSLSDEEYQNAKKTILESNLQVQPSATNRGKNAVIEKAKEAKSKAKRYDNWFGGLLLVSLLGFVASCYAEEKRTGFGEGPFLAGLLNPVFFIGFVLCCRMFYLSVCYHRDARELTNQAKQPDTMNEVN